MNDLNEKDKLILLEKEKAISIHALDQIKTSEIKDLQDKLQINFNSNFKF